MLDAPSISEQLWTHLYTPAIEVAETSCLGFYVKLMRYRHFQVQLVWLESHIIYEAFWFLEGFNKVSTLTHHMVVW